MGHGNRVKVIALKFANTCCPACFISSKVLRDLLENEMNEKS